MNKIILMIFLSPVIFFANPDIDSLKSKVKQSIGPEKVNVLNTFVKKYLSIDVDSALYYAQKSLRIAKFFGSETLMANSASLVGRAYLQLPSPQYALDWEGRRKS